MHSLFVKRRNFAYRSRRRRGLADTTVLHPNAQTKMGVSFKALLQRVVAVILYIISATKVVKMDSVVAT